MTLSIVAAFPIESKLVPSFLENIIDKRVAGIALNLLEKTIHWICSWIYCPYNTLYKAKMARIHLFSDSQALLLDSTKQGIAKIDKDSISLHGKKVYFNLIPHVETIFSREAFTDYVVVQDDEHRRPGWYKIVHQETPHPGNLRPMEKYWMVNTNQLHQFLGGPPSRVYLAEQIDT